VPKRREWSEWQLSKALIFLILCAFLLLSGVASCSGASESDAQSAIDEASQRVIACYGAVANTSNAGAYASALLSVLDDAGDLLSRADVAFVRGDFGSGHDLALQSLQRLDGVDAEAGGLEKAAVQARYVDFMYNVVGPLVEAMIVLLGSFFVWSWFKKR
jgi:hypothetical protein